MANNYFRFKQFTILQNKSAMRVTTDACVFGAWINECIKKRNLKCETALDIGTGTGLLALIFDQENNAKIDAIEIQKDAYEEAKQNFQNASTKHEINLHFGDIQNFEDKQFNVVLCNPPFFKQSLTSPHEHANLAKHENKLSLDIILTQIEKRLHQHGTAFLLMPYERKNEVDKLIQSFNFHIHSTLVLKHNDKKSPLRMMYGFSFQQLETTQETLIIKNAENSYTTEFEHLLSPYYLDK